MELSFPLSIKSLEEAGTFTGLASTYGNLDLGGDICEVGCFTNTLQKRGNEIPLLWVHNQASPVGLAKLTDSPEGLHVAGAIDLDTTIGRETHSGLKKKYIKGLSIGYRIPEGGAAMQGTVRLLKQVDLFEVSLVPVPMNERAQVLAVKSVATLRDFEKLLHGLGWSKSESARIASHGWRGLELSDPEPAEGELLEWLKQQNGGR